MKNRRKKSLAKRIAGIKPGSIHARKEMNVSTPEVDSNIKMLDSSITAMLDDMFDEISRQQTVEQRLTLRQEDGAQESLPAAFDAVKQQALKSFLLVSFELERIGRKEVNATVAEVRKMIAVSLANGKTPVLHDLAQSLGVKSKLESCPPNNEVVALLVAILEDNRRHITEHYGLNNSVFDAGVAKIKALEVAPFLFAQPVQYDEESLNKPAFLRKLSSFGKLEKGIA